MGDFGFSGQDALREKIEQCFGVPQFDDVGGGLELIKNRDLGYGMCLIGSGIVESVSFEAQQGFPVCPGEPDAVTPGDTCCIAIENATSCQLTKEGNIDQQCKDLLDEVVFNTYECNTKGNENAPLVVILVLMAVLFFVLMTFFRHRALGALLRKNVILWKQTVITSIFVQTFETVLVGILAAILLGFTSMKIEYFYIDLLNLQIKIETPDDNRSLIYQNLRPFGGLFFLIVFTFPISSMTVSIVSEKEAKMKEAMKMAGLDDFSLMFSWMLTFMLTYLPMVLGVSVLANYGAIFPNTSVSSIALFFLSFVYAMGGLSFITAVFFTKTRPAAVASICLAYLLFFSSFHFLSEATVDEKRQGCLIAPVCLALGVDVMLDEATFGTGFALAAARSALDRSNLSVPLYECMLRLILAGTLYLFLAWYLDKVVPQEYGVRRRPDFIFQPLYPHSKKFIEWSREKLGYENNLMGKNGMKRVESNAEDPSTNAASSDELSSSDIEMQQDEFSSKNKIVIKDLVKVFKINGMSEKRYAINHLNLSLEKGQITVLLGPNGAGKSTTFGVLTGLIEPTSGSVSIFGNDVQTEMHKIRGSMGWCPQHDIIYPTLTVKQHLELFSALRNKKLDMASMKEMLRELNILEKLNRKAKTLSGGQKRKLCLAMALTGDTDVVYLDEVSAGVDPFSRRSMWSVLQNNRRGRAIILTTHFMDEADALGDKIAIMANGNLCCEGTSLELKKKYGSGYLLSVGSKSGGFPDDPNKVIQMVTKEIPNAKTVDAKNEMQFQLPFVDAHKFPKVLRKLDYELKCHVGISITTLEEVFLKVAEEFSDTSLSLESLNQTAPYIEQYKPRFRTLSALIWKRINYAKRDIRVFALIIFLPLLFTLALFVVPEIKVYGLIFQSEGAFAPQNTVCEANLLRANPSKDRWIRTFDSTEDYVTYPLVRNEKLDLVGKRCCPTILEQEQSIIATEYRLECLKSLPQCVSMDEETAKTAQNNCYKNEYSYCYIFPWNCLAKECCDPTNAKSPYYVCQSFTEFEPGNIFNPQFANYNNYCGIQLVTVAQGYVNAFVRSVIIMLGMVFPAGTIIAFAVMEKEAHRNTKFQQLVNGVKKFTYWFSHYVFDQSTVLLPAILFPIIISSIRPSSLNYDGATIFQAFYLVLGWCFSMVWSSYAMSFSYSQHAKALVGVIIFHIVTGAALATLGYILEVINIEVTNDLTTRELMGDYIRFILSIFPAFAFTDGLLRLQTQLVNQCGTSNDLRNLAVCTNILSKSVREGYASSYQRGDFVSEALLQRRLALGVEELGGMENVVGEYTMYYTDSLISLAYMIAVGLVCFLYIVIRESRGANCCSCCKTDRIAKRHKKQTIGNLQVAQLIDEEEEDGLEINSNLYRKSFEQMAEMHGSFTKRMITQGMDDVNTEKLRVQSQTEDDAVQVLGLTKKYPKKIAVDNMFLGIKKGECFGLLGANGAGKSTTMKMLTGFEKPSSGTATVFGDSVLTRIGRIRKNYLGYCPQFDALYDLLTVKEHLEMYSKIRGLTNVPLAVDSSIKRLQLGKFRNVVSKQLSGGNKRKLSAAIAMLGSPKLVMLDEPSSGMDPHAQRFLWNVVDDTVNKTNCSVILTSHSMIESETLSNRIGIMIKGKLRCLGSPHQLKVQYGNGYTIEVGLKHDSSMLQAPNQYLDDGFVTLANIELVCNALGIPSRASLLSPEGDQSNSSVAFLLNNKTIAKCHWDEFSSWWVEQDNVERLVSFLKEKLQKKNVLLADRHRTNLTFQVTSDLHLSDIFELLELNQHEFKVEHYSISQSGLEDVFNSFVEELDMDHNM